MLKVIKILEGGIDLETREELPRSIVISNGRREVHVPANDIVIRELVGLLADNRDAKMESAGPVVDKSSGHPGQDFGPAAASAPATSSTPIFEEEEPKGKPYARGEGFEPGEEFSDSGTGASSL